MPLKVGEENIKVRQYLTEEMIAEMVHTSLTTWLSIEIGLAHQPILAEPTLSIFATMIPTLVEVPLIHILWLKESHKQCKSII